MEGKTGPASTPSSPTPPQNSPATSGATPTDEGGATPRSGVQPGAKPKMAGLQPNQAPKKSLRSRIAQSKQGAKPTSGMGKPNTPEALQRKKQQVLSAVNDLSIKHGKLKILGEALEALKTPETVPKGMIIKVQIGDKMVAIVPPDEEGLRGQNRTQLLKDVEGAVKGSYQACINSVGQEALPEQLRRLEGEFMQVCTKLGKQQSKPEVMRAEWNSAFTAIPRKMKVDYSGGTVLIEKVVVTKPKPPQQNPNPNQQPSGQPPSDQPPQG